MDWEAILTSLFCVSVLFYWAYRTSLIVDANSETSAKSYYDFILQVTGLRRLIGTKPPQQVSHEPDL